MVDYQVPELKYGLQSTTMTGVMERTILPGLQQTVITGEGGCGVSGGGPITVLVEDTGGSSSTGTSTIPTVPTTPTYPTYQQPAYTSADSMAYKDGHIGTIKIPSLKIDMKLWEGDTITYTTMYGTRTYSVTLVKTISNTDWSYLQATSDNRSTLTTCLADHPESRVVIQAVEVRS